MAKNTNKIPAAAPVIITDLEQLLFNTFIRCIVDNDMSGLVISGKPDEYTLYAGWMTLLSKYYELSGSKDAAKYVKNASKMEAINTKVLQVTAVLDAVRSISAVDFWQDVLQLVDLLRQWGYNAPFTQKSIGADVAKIGRLISNDRLKLAQLKLKYSKEEEEKGKREETSTKEDWMRTLHAIEDYKKRGLDRATLSMYDFALYCKELQEHIAFMTTQNLKNGSR